MATEIEIKLNAPDLETLNRAMEDPELVQCLKDDYVDTHMISVYYDTEDRVLNERRWTLRLRNEGGRKIVAFKTDTKGAEGGFFTRNEWQCSVDSVEDAIPVLIDMGAPRQLKSLLKGRKLSPSCGAEFDRKSGTLFLEDGVRVEIAADYGYLYKGDSRETICELELELMFGDAVSLVPLAEQLKAEYGLENAVKSKYERAKDLN